MSTIEQRKIIESVLAERDRQDDLFPVQSHSPEFWLVILMEEVGEASEEVIEAKFAKSHREAENHLQCYRTELIQVAATAIAAIESLDRQADTIAHPEKVPGYKCSHDEVEKIDYVSDLQSDIVECRACLLRGHRDPNGGPITWVEGSNDTEL